MDKVAHWSRKISIYCYGKIERVEMPTRWPPPKRSPQKAKRMALTQALSHWVFSNQELFSEVNRATHPAQLQPKFNKATSHALPMPTSEETTKTAQLQSEINNVTSHAQPPPWSKTQGHTSHFCLDLLQKIHFCIKKGSLV